jgi:hypothetical protein
MSVEQLCKMMKSSSVEFDEREELEDFVSKKYMNLDDISQTDDRYRRYLEGIQCWIYKGKSFLYIKEGLEQFIQIPSIPENFSKKVKWMRKIDKEIMNVLVEQ